MHWNMQSVNNFIHIKIMESRFLEKKIKKRKKKLGFYRLKYVAYTIRTYIKKVESE